MAWITLTEQKQTERLGEHTCGSQGGGEGHGMDWDCGVWN